MINPTDIVYLAGPMSGLPDFNRAAFNAAERMLRELGCNVLNPARQPDGLEYEEYMRRGLADVEAANVIVLLPGWNHSPGAIRELARAIQPGLRVEIFNGSEFPNGSIENLGVEKEKS